MSRDAYPHDAGHTLGPQELRAAVSLSKGEGKRDRMFRQLDSLFR
jgi:hypothetical protein